MSKHFVGGRCLHLHGMTMVSTGSDNDATAGYVNRRFGFQNGGLLTSYATSSVLHRARCMLLFRVERTTSASRFTSKASNGQPLRCQLESTPHATCPPKMRTATAIVRNESSSGLATRAPLRDYIRKCLWGGERALLSCRKGSSNMQTVTQLVCTSRTY